MPDPTASTDRKTEERCSRPVPFVCQRWVGHTGRAVLEFPRFSGHLTSCAAKARKDRVCAEDPRRVAGPAGRCLLGGAPVRTAGGTRFSPQFIENKLKFSPFVGECVVLGNGRPFLAAILCIRYSMVAKWAEARRISFTTYQNLAAHPQAGELLAAVAEAVVEAFIGPCDEPVEGHRHVENGGGHGGSSVLWF